MAGKQPKALQVDTEYMYILLRSASDRCLGIRGRQTNAVPLFAKSRITSSSGLENERSADWL